MLVKIESIKELETFIFLLERDGRIDNSESSLSRSYDIRSIFNHKTGSTYSLTMRSNGKYDVLTNLEHYGKAISFLEFFKLQRNN